MTQADGAVWQYCYTDASAKRIVLNGFDGNGRVGKQTYADGTTTQMSYVADGGGKVTRADVTDRRGNVRRVLFDAQQRIVENTYPVGKPEEQTHRFTYDPATGRMATQTDALGRVTRYGYDLRGNRTAITRLDGTADAQTERFVLATSLNLPTSHTDPAGLVTEYQYDAEGNLSNLKLPDGQRCQYTHDEFGRVIAVTDPAGKVTQRTYAGADLATERDPLGNTTQFGYDAVGRLLVTRDALGNQAEWQYDPMSRATLLRDGGGNAVRLEYDAMGNLRTYRDPADNATTYARDTRHRVDRRTDAPLNSDARVYDEADALKRYTARTGKVSGRRYDGHGRVVFEGFGAPTDQPKRYSEGLRYQWDGGNRPVRLEQGSCSGAECGSFTPSSTIVRTWDNLDRLTSETSEQGRVSYTYRADGQRDPLQVQGLPGEVAGDAVYNANNQLRNWGGEALSYDAEGALQSHGATQYEWDVRGRLARITQGGTEVAAYGYDGLNRRIWRRTGARTQGYLYDGWDVVQELNAANANAGRTNYAANVVNGLGLDERYVRIVAPHSGEAGQPDNASNPSATQPMVTALLGDALGSTQLVLRADEQVQARYVYEPYGQVQQHTPEGQPPSDNPYQYTGREYEGATLAGNSPAAPLGQLYHYRHRYYSAAPHRFLSEDPIEFGGGSNLFAYVGGNPLTRSDPRGLSWSILSSLNPTHMDCYDPDTGPAIPPPVFPSSDSDIGCELQCNIAYGPLCFALGLGATRLGGGGAGVEVGLACNMIKYRACQKQCAKRNCMGGGE